MYCNNCGKDVAEGLTYCDACGAELNAETFSDEELDIAPAKDTGKTLGIVSLILSIASVILGVPCSCACACLGGIVPFLCAVGSIVTGAIGMSKSKAAGYKNTLGLIGIIISVVAIIVIIVFVIINAVLGGMSSFAQTPYYNQF